MQSSHLPPMSLLVALCGVGACDTGGLVRDAATDSTSSSSDSGNLADSTAPVDSTDSITDSGSRDTAPTQDTGAPRDASRPDSSVPPGDASVGPTSPLPSGNTGIASRYAGDRNIEDDPQVIFADDFESYDSPTDLDRVWDARYHNVTITTTAANVYRGSKAVDFRAPMTSSEVSNGLDFALAEERDVLFLRYYSRFESTFDVVGSSHNGSTISAHYYIDGRATPGIPADGRNKFLIAYESWRGEESTPNPGDLNLYVYHPEQRSMWGDHWFPTGIVMPYTSTPYDFGDDFVMRPDVNPDLGRWYCYELMVRANTPGIRDGRVAIWLDGAIIGDFMNLRLRDVATLRMDRVGIGLHTHSNPSRETRKWYDNVVIATSYIGPLVD